LRLTFQTFCSKYNLVFTQIVLLKCFWCGVYSGSIWEWKYASYWEAVWKLFQTEKRNFKASLQKSANIVCSYVQNLMVIALFASENCPGIAPHIIRVK